MDAAPTMRLHMQSLPRADRLPGGRRCLDRQGSCCVLISSTLVIGYVGSTGQTTANYLHFEIRLGGGVAVNPYLPVRQNCRAASLHRSAGAADAYDCVPVDCLESDEGAGVRGVDHHSVADVHADVADG